MKTPTLRLNSARRVLQREKIGVCDIVGAAYRDKIDASDLGMQQPELRDVLGILKKHPTVDTLIFTGGNSKTWPRILLSEISKKRRGKLRSARQ